MPVDKPTRQPAWAGVAFHAEHFDVGVDVRDYPPVTRAQIIAKPRRRQ